MLTPHVPPWAVAAGVPPPEPGESFEAVCRRLGIPEWAIRGFLDGLEGLTLECANARLSSYLVVTQPEAFSRAVVDLRQRREREKAPLPPSEEDPLASILSERYS